MSGDVCPPVVHPPRCGATPAWRLLEGAAWVAGVVLLGSALLARGIGTLQADAAIAAFHDAQQAALPPPPPPPPGAEPRPDVRLWSAHAVRAWHESRDHAVGATLALLRVPRLGLEVPVLDGTDEWTLNRAVGHIEDTAAPGTDGNVGVAGHRDSFFRSLKDIVAGDAIEVEIIGRVDRYTVERTWIVEPDDVSVLDPTPGPALTLVTCYPFYVAGSAPRRFIVRAVRTATARPRPS